jgi:phage-related protein
MIFVRIRGPHLEKRREFFLQDLEEVVLPAHILTDRSNETVEAPQDSKFKIWRRMSELIEHLSEVNIPEPLELSPLIAP